jgi:hypothetical protein
VFALLFGAIAWGRPGIHWRDFVPDWRARLPLTRLVAVLFVVPVLLLAGNVLSSVREDVLDVQSSTYMAGAAAWLQANTAPGEMIFQTDWDDFTRLFYHNTANTYLVGLDPTYLQIADPFLWNQWVAITQGRTEHPSQLIRELFGARYVVSDRRHDDFADQAAVDPNMQIVYMDDSSFIWEITDKAD